MISFRNICVGILVSSVALFLAGEVSAEPQFGGRVEVLKYCDCNEVWYLEVGDPHGGNYIKDNTTEIHDCEPLSTGEFILGMHTETTEECMVVCGEDCCSEGSGKVIEYYGTSPSNCETGLDGDASGEDKEEMITPDGRTADGGDEDDGGPSGGASQATQADTHLETVDGVKADGTVSGGGETEHMETSDHQNDEGDGTTHMIITSDNNRDYEGNNDTVMTSSGNGSGYSSAGGGRSGHGFGSVGGSVGSGGLQSPVVLGDTNKIEEKDNNEKDLAASAEIVSINENQNKITKEDIVRIILVLLILGSSGYFVFRSIRKVF